MTDRIDGHLLADLLPEGSLRFPPGAITLRLFTGDPLGPGHAAQAGTLSSAGYTRNPAPSWTSASWTTVTWDTAAREDDDWWEESAMRWAPDD